MTSITTKPYHSYTKQLALLLSKSKNQKNPALWLHSNNARTCVFMLEGITRIIKRTTDDSFSSKLHKIFKKLEDELGKIDYYISLERELSANQNISENAIGYFRKKLEKNLEKFNKKLKKKNFYEKELKQLETLDKTDYNDKAFWILVHEQIKTEIMQAEEFFNKHEEGFTEMETQVHELRRKLRWISIYAQALQGRIVLNAHKSIYKWEKEFLIKEITNSSFNKLPVKKGLNYYIPLNQKAFYALSYLIQELGTIKDKALTIEALAKALKKTHPLKLSDVEETAAEQLGEKENIEQLLKNAHQLLSKFFNLYAIHLELLKV